MQLQQDRLVVSATDLVGFLECDHLVTLELEAVRGDREKPFRSDPQLDLIRQRGYDHEQRYLETLRAAGRTIHEIAASEARTLADLEAAEGETLEAMRAGKDVIFQATFFDGRWRGHADFLLRRDDRPSSLGAWSYDVADTKLAKRVKAAAIIQMCVYADLLERLQGIPPETISVVTGDGREHPHRLDDYAAYYRAAKARFEARVFADESTEAPETYPEPVDHCRVCRWWPVCIDRRRADDHLSIVAGLARTHWRRLVEDDVGTLAELAVLDPDRTIRGIPPRIAERLRRQAALQLDYRVTGQLSYELIPPNPVEPGKGLAALPEPSPLDVFFDIEADPWALDDGLEYLLGWSERIDGDDVYHAIWAHDRAGEKAAFEAFVDLVMERLERDPHLHVYHYGGYESGALKRLMQRHATREDEVDRLLRGRILVNLYDHVVRSAIRASVESYSIKQIEKFYLPQREGPITDAGFSVVEYEHWMETGDEAILGAIADYNRDDCVSTAGLQAWLEGLRGEAAPLFPDGVVPRPAPEDPEPSASLAAAQAETHEREDALRTGLKADRANRNDEQQGRWLLAALLDWHRREAKPQWWDWYRLLRAPMDDLVADAAALGELRYLEELGRPARSVIRRYAFDRDQETKLHEGDQVIDPATERSAGVILAIDALAGTVDLRHGPGTPHPHAIIPSSPYGPEPMRSALGRLADSVIAAGTIDGPGPYRAARDLILRRPPRIHGLAPGEPLARPGEAASAAARRLANELDATVLPIQGPPGTGKTHTGARMILDLVSMRRKVGVTAQSHRVIANLLEAVAAAARAEGVQVRIGQRCDEPGDVAPGEAIERIRESAAVAPGLADETWDVVGGTTWLWARPELESSLDVLFVDEAGQLSLAAVCSVAGAADSVVLLGDPNQLAQVSQGVQPEGAAASALEHVVAGLPTVPPDRGLFLGTTYRLHPDVNAYVSDAFYEGRLETHRANARQLVGPGEPVGGTGIRYVPRVHAGNGNRSRDEADWVASAIEGLVGRTWTDRDGLTRPLVIDDVIVVAPYNAQVVEIASAVERRLGRRPNVGTVDKFQGREGAVAIYSMATSTPEEAPRDLEFLFSANRLNVAISRARGLAVLVASPALLRVACRTPEQMRLVNKLCRLAEFAAAQAPGLIVGSAMPTGPPASTGEADADEPGPTERYEPLELGLG